MTDRDRTLARARRLRQGLVAGGAAGSLGVAAVVGLPALQQAGTSTQTAGSGTSGRSAPHSDDGVGQNADDHGGGWVFDDGGATPTVPSAPRQWTPPTSSFAPPSTGNGTTPHAGSSGS